MNALAQALGYMVLFAGGALLAGLAVAMACNYLWRKTKLAYDFSVLQDAMAEWKQNHPSK